MSPRPRPALARAALLGAGVMVLAGCAAPVAADAPAPAASSSAASSSAASSSAASPSAAAPTSSAASSWSAPAAPSSTASSAGQPPAKISMICSDKEVLERLTTLVGADAVAKRTSTWQDGLYTCRYPGAGGTIVISVKQPPTGTERAWFDGQRARYRGITTIDGLDNFGLPAARTPDGVALFLNDGMTLTVDTRGLTQRSADQRADDAYGIASVVIACWQHDSF